MAKNDLILIDSIIEERVSENLPSNRKDEVFEFLSYEQVLKEYDLSADDIKSAVPDMTCRFHKDPEMRTRSVLLSAAGLFARKTARRRYSVPAFPLFLVAYPADIVCLFLSYSSFRRFLFWAKEAVDGLA